MYHEGIDDSFDGPNCQNCYEGKEGLTGQTHPCNAATELLSLKFLILNRPRAWHHPSLKRILKLKFLILYQLHLPKGGEFGWIRLTYWAVLLKRLGNCIVCKRFAVQTLQSSMEFVTLDKSLGRHHPGFKRSSKFKFLKQGVDIHWSIYNISDSVENEASYKLRQINVTDFLNWNNSLLTFLVLFPLYKYDA